MSDDKVSRLPVRFKRPPGEDEQQLQLVQPGPRECDHRYVWRGGVPGRMTHVRYLIREGETEVECGSCGTRLDPMWVLRQLAIEETQWHEAAKRYQEEMARLEERERTKCQHCGKMTRISRR